MQPKQQLAFDDDDDDFQRHSIHALSSLIDAGLNANQAPLTNPSTTAPTAPHPPSMEYS